MNKDFFKSEIERFALRYNTGKPEWSLVDFSSLEDMVRVLEYGAKKYDKHNWKRGLKTTEIIDSMMRHMVSYLRGEDIDSESGLPHTGHILCNAMFLSHMYRLRPDMDSRDTVSNNLCCGNWDEQGICKCKK